MELAIRTEHLTKIYSQRLIAVNDMNLEVPQGSVFGILGPNGAGKTTTLRLLLGFSAMALNTAGNVMGPLVLFGGKNEAAASNLINVFFGLGLFLTPLIVASFLERPPMKKLFRH